MVLGARPGWVVAVEEEVSEACPAGKRVERRSEALSTVVPAVRLTTSAEVMGGGGRRVEARTEASEGVMEGYWGWEGSGERVSEVYPRRSDVVFSMVAAERAAAASTDARSTRVAAGRLEASTGGIMDG